MAFQMRKVQDALMPEVAGMGIILGADVLAATKDADSTDTGWKAEKYQYMVQLAGLLGGGYLMGSRPTGDTWEEIGKGAFITAFVIVGANGAKWLYDQIKGDNTASGLALIKTSARAQRIAGRAVGRAVRGSQQGGMRLVGPNQARMGTPARVGAPSRASAGTQYLLPKASGAGMAPAIPSQSYAATTTLGNRVMA